MAVHASAGREIPQGNEGLGPVARKQLSLYHAAKALKGEERLKRLYGILKWPPWLAEAARCVLGMTEPLDPSGSVGHLVDFVLRVGRDEYDIECCEACGVGQGFHRDAAGVSSIGLTEDAILKAAILMILIPIYNGGHGGPQGYDGARIAEGIRQVIGTHRGYQWVIHKALKVPRRILKPRALNRVLGKRIADRRFLRMTTQVLGLISGSEAEASHEMDWNPSSAFRSFLEDIYLTAFDEWFSRRFHELEPAVQRRRSRHGVPCAGGLRFGRDLVIFVDGSMGQAQAVGCEVENFLKRQLGVECRDVAPIMSCEDFEFLGFHIAGSGHGKYGAFTIEPSRDAIKAYKEEIRGLTGVHRQSGFSPEVVTLRINWLIRGWKAYFSGIDTGRIAFELERWTYERLYGFLRRRHRGLTRRELLKIYSRDGSDAPVRARAGSRSRTLDIPVPGSGMRLPLESFQGDPGENTYTALPLARGVVSGGGFAAVRLDYQAEPVVSGSKLHPSRHTFSAMVREIVLARDGARCGRCGGGGALGVYDERTGRAPGGMPDDIRRLDQMVVLCASCRGL